MGRDAMKAAGNICFECRKAAAKYNEKLASREGAAEALGVSVSSLADYELGNTKVIPVDKIVLMADLYNAPELMLWYCSHECPVGKLLPVGGEEAGTLERTTLKLLRQLKKSGVEKACEMLVEISADGVVDEHEKKGLADVLAYIDELIKAASELRVMGLKVLNEEKP